MKIAFINPPFLSKFSRGQRSPGVTKAGTLYYPYWLSYATGWAQKNGFEVRLFDFIATGNFVNEAIKKVVGFNPDLVVQETSTPSIDNDLFFAKKLKKTCPKTFFLLVGTHISALPKESLLKAREINGVAVGEYDQTVVDLARCLVQKSDLKKVEGLVFWQGKKLIANKPRKPIENLNALPFVSRVYKEFLNPKDYYFAAADYPMVMIMTGRGCPFGCSFCVWPQVMHGLRYRFRSPENVAREFKYIQENLPQIKEVVIEDDTFTANIDRVRKICQLLFKQKNSLKWSTNCRVHLDLGTMQLMKKAGCRLLIVGYESGSQKVLDGMGKKIKLEDSLKFAKNAKKAGLLVHGCFMFGNPGETRETMTQTLEFAKKLDPDSAQFYPLYVYPGTKAYSLAKSRGYLKTRNFRQWLTGKGEHACVINLPGLSSKQMMEFADNAYLSFHLRPKYLFKKFIQLGQNPEEGIRSLRSGFRYLHQLIFK